MGRDGAACYLDDSPRHERLHGRRRMKAEVAPHDLVRVRARVEARGRATATARARVRAMAMARARVRVRARVRARVRVAPPDPIRELQRARAEAGQ